MYVCMYDDSFSKSLPPSISGLLFPLIVKVNPDIWNCASGITANMLYILGYTHNSSLLSDSLTNPHPHFKTPLASGQSHSKKIAITLKEQGCEIFNSFWDGLSKAYHVGKQTIIDNADHP